MIQKTCSTFRSMLMLNAIIASHVAIAAVTLLVEQSKFFTSALLIYSENLVWEAMQIRFDN